MWCCSGYAQHRLWASSCLTAENGSLDLLTQQTYIKNNLTGFIGWLLLHICSIGSRGRRQLFYLTFILHYYGLSREGIDYIYKYGLGVSLNMFDKLRVSCREESNQHTR